MIFQKAWITYTNTIKNSQNGTGKQACEKKNRNNCKFRVTHWNIMKLKSWWTLPFITKLHTQRRVMNVPLGSPIKFLDRVTILGLIREGPRNDQRKMRFKHQDMLRTITPNHFPYTIF
jgi:hypothetical protein